MSGWVVGVVRQRGEAETVGSRGFRGWAVHEVLVYVRCAAWSVRSGGHADRSPGRQRTDQHFQGRNLGGVATLGVDRSSRICHEYPLVMCGGRFGRRRRWRCDGVVDCDAPVSRPAIF